jgi:hypothetical protein
VFCPLHASLLAALERGYQTPPFIRIIQARLLPVFTLSPGGCLAGLMLIIFYVIHEDRSGSLEKRSAFHVIL